MQHQNIIKSSYSNKHNKSTQLYSTLTQHRCNQYCTHLTSNQPTYSAIPHTAVLYRTISTDTESIENESPSTDEVNQITSFLKQINCDEYADKFKTFNELLSTPSIHLKLKHNIPIQQRKLIRKLSSRYIHQYNVLYDIKYNDEYRKVEQLEKELRQQIKPTRKQIG